MSVDLRRFEYGFEPLLRQRQWQLEALHARLGALVGEIDAASATLARSRERYQVECERAAARQIDPRLRLDVARWLARLRSQIADRERSLAELRDRRTELARACLAQQDKVEAIERHRAECLTDFVRDEEGRVARDADRDWLSRLHRRAVLAEDAP
jgi:uncharacterized protein YdiU (UPF0061 family)